MALIAFMALQFALRFFSKRAPSGGWAWISFFLFFVTSFGVANWFLTSMGAEALEFSKLDPSQHVAFLTAGVAFTFVGFVVLIRFILTRF